MNYFKAANDIERRDNLIAFRASTEDRQKAEALKCLMNVASTSAVFRALLDSAVEEYGVN